VKRRFAKLGILLLTWPLRLAELLETEVTKHSCAADETARFLPGSSIVNRGTREQIRVGAHSHIRGQLLTFGPGAPLSIGSYCYVGDNSRIWCAVGVTIGDRVLIAHNVNIHDNNAHPLSASARHLQALEIFAGREDPMTDVRMSPIVIEDDVWIGFNSTILKGVTIGRGAIIGAETVITKNVPPYAIVIGTPQRQSGVALE
jgi:acetyltransferase-like isoleucine patch superfamily enzyme